MRGARKESKPRRKKLRSLPCGGRDKRKQLFTRPRKRNREEEDDDGWVDGWGRDLSEREQSVVGFPNGEGQRGRRQGESCPLLLLLLLLPCYLSSSVLNAGWAGEDCDRRRRESGNRRSGAGLNGGRVTALRF
ncbi:hypothetical protein VPH35_086855 [Triticum aestivum]